MTTPPTTKQQRKQDALDRLEHEADAWVATADGQSGTPYLVPLSFLWDGATLLLSTPSSSPTSRNLLATGRVRIGIGPTRDLVLVEGQWRRPAAAGIPEAVGDAFAAPATCPRWSGSTDNATPQRATVPMAALTHASGPWGTSTLRPSPGGGILDGGAWACRCAACCADIAQQFVTHLPNAELELLPGAGPAVWIDDPDHAATTTRRFLGP